MNLSNVRALAKPLPDLPTGDWAALRATYLMVQWNEPFAGAVAHLVSEVHKCRSLCIEDDKAPIPGFGDRGPAIAGLVARAAADEYGGRETHRELGKKLVRAMYDAASGINAASAVRVPHWFHSSRSFGVHGYWALALGGPNSRSIAKALGWHLASEALATQEFDLLRELLKNTSPEMRAAVSGNDAWVRAHASSGDDVEETHARYALQAAEEALKVFKENELGDLSESVQEGVRGFIRSRDEFFSELVHDLWTTRP